jgi:hypothetical protein
MRKYEPTEGGKLGVAFLQASGVAAIIFSTAMGGGIVALAFVQRIPSVDPPALGTLVCVALWAWAIGWTVGLGLINVYPTIWTDDEHLIISAFLVARVAIPWAEVLDVGAGRVLFGHTLVRARRITPFHRFYGWLYSRTLYPSFVIGRWIQDRDDLIREITWRSRQARLSSPQT